MNEKTDSQLCDFVLQEWKRPVPHEVIVAAKDIAGRYEGSVDGILFYGSCLRTGEIEEKVLDFYVVVDSYSRAYKKTWLAVANKMIPPNVFYHEITVDGMVVRSKYAVISRSDLANRAGPKCLNVSIWARFCQPCVLLLAKNDVTKNCIAADIANAAKTMISHALPIMVPSSDHKIDSRAVWVEAFENTYAAELRSERAGKGLEIYLLDQDRYDTMFPLIVSALGHDESKLQRAKKQPAFEPRYKARVKWFFRRVNGKFVSFMRLIKATFTFDGGIDYIAWKIRRHSGVEIEVTDWMRNHPILAGISLFWRMKKKGAFK